jgi:hypothetical protein
MSRVTFPHLGSLYITAEHSFRAFGLEPVTPPAPTRRTLDNALDEAHEKDWTVVDMAREWRVVYSWEAV